MLTARGTQVDIYTREHATRKTTQSQNGQNMHINFISK